jgi:hypothetical protein
MKHLFPAFALVSFALLGCGKDAPPAPTPAPAPAAPAVVKEVVHELDVAKHDIPAQPVSGRIGGKLFTPDRVELDGNMLTFRQGPALSPDTQLMVVVQLPIPTDADFRSVTRADQKSVEAIPMLYLTTKTDGTLKNDEVTEGYALTLELGKPANGQVNGKIHLSLPGAEKSVIAGTFSALYDRSATAPPSDGDKPYVTGAITPMGAPGSTLIVGYVRLPAAGQEQIYDTVQTMLPTNPTDPVGAVRATANKPRTATVRPNEDGKGTEYDLTKLPPGKYLIAARIEGGIPAWIVREVKADSALTAPISLPTGGAGHIDVDVPGLPADALVQVQVLPAEVALDEPTGQFEAHAGLVVGTWANLEKGKATIKQLPAGDYVVSARSAEIRYVGKVKVIAGQGAKVELKPAP